jgi:superfamily II DNA/RNA helicase
MRVGVCVQLRALAFDSFVNGQKSVLVCTDIGSRGLDTTFVNVRRAPLSDTRASLTASVPFVQTIVNFDFPLNSVDYLHRAGRTGRLGRRGQAISLVAAREKHFAAAIQARAPTR